MENVLDKYGFKTAYFEFIERIFKNNLIIFISF